MVSRQSSGRQTLARRYGSLALLACLSCTPPKPSSPVRNVPARPELPYNRILFAGDVMFSRAVRRTVLAAKDPALPFRKIAPLTSAADITFINLETPFSDQGPYHDDGLIFHAAPEMIAALQLGGVRVASTANNHSRDCAAHGVEYTVRWLRSHGILPVGSGDSAQQTHEGVVITSKGIRFGFLAYTYDQKNGNWKDFDDRIANTDPLVMTQDVRSLRRRADVVIVSTHQGIEYMPKASKDQIAFAHAAIDAGADLVIGHHPHVVQESETYRGRQIFYSLGNFVFDQYQREATQHGEMVEVSFLGTKVLSTYVMPVKITPTGPELE